MNRRKFISVASIVGAGAAIVPALNDAKSEQPSVEKIEGMDRDKHWMKIGNDPGRESIRKSLISKNIHPAQMNEFMFVYDSFYRPGLGPKGCGLSKFNIVSHSTHEDMI